jgi:hypothetical protein
MAPMAPDSFALRVFFFELRAWLNLAKLRGIDDCRPLGESIPSNLHACLLKS